MVKDVTEKGNTSAVIDLRGFQKWSFVEVFNSADLVVDVGFFVTFVRKPIYTSNVEHILLVIRAWL